WLFQPCQAWQGFYLSVRSSDDDCFYNAGLVPRAGANCNRIGVYAAHPHPGQGYSGVTGRPRCTRASPDGNRQNCRICLANVTTPGYAEDGGTRTGAGTNTRIGDSGG